MTSYTSFAKILNNNNKKDLSEPSGLCHSETQYIKHLSGTEPRVVIAFIIVMHFRFGGKFLFSMIIGHVFFSPVAV